LRFPRSLISADGGGAQLYPCSIAACPSQSYPRPHPIHRTAALNERMCDRLPHLQRCASPYPPDSSRLTNRGASDAGSLFVVAPSRLACATAVSGSATAPLRCQGCSRSTAHLRVQPALSFSRPLRRSREELSLLAAYQRLVAHSPARRRLAACNRRVDVEGAADAFRRAPRVAR
jgi:hypothetical protein